MGKVEQARGRAHGVVFADCITKMRRQEPTVLLEQDSAVRTVHLRQ